MFVSKDLSIKLSHVRYTRHCVNEDVGDVFHFNIVRILHDSSYWSHLPHIPTHELIGITRVELNQVKLAILAHVEQCAGKANTQMLLHTKTCPLMGPLQNVSMWKALMNIQTNLPKLCELHVHVLRRNIMMHKLKNALHHCPSCNIPSCPWRYTNHHPSTFCKRLHDPLEDSHPLQTNFDFLVQHRKLVNFSLTTIWKCVWVNGPPLSTKHNVVMHSSNELPQLHKDGDVNIGSPPPPHPQPQLLLTL